MSIQDIEERLWVRTQIGTEAYWIGLTDRAVEGVWEWSDGGPFITYLSYWMAGQPDDWGEEPGEDCGPVAGGNFGQWSDENCDVERKYICKHVNANPGPRCDVANGWRQHASDCYKMKADGHRGWAAARRDCVQEGGDLVSVTSAEEEQFVTGTVAPPWIDLWIGLSTLKCNKLSCQVEATNTQYAWSDALHVEYTNWAEGEPTSHLPSRLAELRRQLLLAGQQHRPVDHLARGLHQVLWYGGPPAGCKQRRRTVLRQREPSGLPPRGRSRHLDRSIG